MDIDFKYRRIEPCAGAGRLACVLGLAALMTAGAAVAAPLDCMAPPAGLAAWWSGEDNALDRLGSFPGTLAHGTGFGPGFVGRAFQFDGIDDSMLVGLLGGVGLTETEPLTIAAWINTGTANAAPLQVIAGNYMGEGGGTGNFSMHLRIDSGNLTFAIDQRQLAGTSVTTSIASGWHFLAASYDGNLMALYVDGGLRESAQRSFTGSTANTRGWTIGNFSDETNAAHGYSASFNGLIDEVAVFARALGAGEVNAIFTAGSAGLCTPTLFANGFEGN